MALLSQLQFEALSFEPSHVRYFSQVFPPLPRARLNSRAHYPLGADLAGKVAKRLQNQIAINSRFTGNLWSCLLRGEEKGCTKKTELSECLSLRCNQFLSDNWTSWEKRRRPNPVPWPDGVTGQGARFGLGSRNSSSELRGCSFMEG